MGECGILAQGSWVPPLNTQLSSLNAEFRIIGRPVRALNLGATTTLESRITIECSFLSKKERNFESHPIAALITHDFPARGALPPVRMRATAGAPAVDGYALFSGRLEDVQSVDRNLAVSGGDQFNRMRSV